jgi:polyisoprenoid-binding protein YceI
MKKILVGISLLISSFSFAQSAKNWKVDNVHSSVRFSVSHLVISEVEGTFKVYDGTISNTKDDFSDAKIDFNIDVASINTENSMRDNHLKADDFFNTEKFPKMTFKSISFKKKAGNMYELIGDLTIRDVTKKAVFSVKYGGTQKDGYGNTKAGFKVTGSINRFDYGLKWNALTEAGGATVGKEVELVGNLEFALAK